MIVLIYISLTLRDAENLSMDLLFICISYLEKYLFKSLAHFFKLDLVVVVELFLYVILMGGKVRDHWMRKRALFRASRALCPAFHLISCHSQQECFALAGRFHLLAFIIPFQQHGLLQQTFSCLHKKHLLASPLEIVLLGLWVMVSLPLLAASMAHDPVLPDPSAPSTLV